MTAHKTVLVLGRPVRGEVLEARGRELHVSGRS